MWYTPPWHCAFEARIYYTCLCNLHLIWRVLSPFLYSLSAQSVIKLCNLAVIPRIHAANYKSMLKTDSKLGDRLAFSSCVSTFASFACGKKWKVIWSLTRCSFKVYSDPPFKRTALSNQRLAYSQSDNPTHPSIHRHHHHSHHPRCLCMRLLVCSASIVDIIPLIVFWEKWGVWPGPTSLNDSAVPWMNRSWIQ